MAFKSGDILYKFTLIKSLGGNFGEVWQASDNSINKEVALKILEPTLEPIAKLLDEARIGNKFNHKNLLSIHYADVASVGGKTYTLIAQEYFKNGDVTNHLNLKNFLPLPQVLKLLQEVLFGLEYLHNGGFYHNDIKPGNILLDDQHCAVLADYGISGYSPSATPIVPKNAYKVHSAPETATGAGQISIYSDLFQVGCTAYRLLNGISNLKNEFNKMGPASYEDEKLKGKIPNIKKYEAFVPTRLKTIINKSLKIDPLDRFGSALEMRRKLEKLVFAGYWTTDSSGDLLGIGKNYNYQFSIVPTSGNLFDFVPTKTSLKSGKTTNVSNFRDKGLSNKRTVELRDKYITWVIENAK
tara:strand:- start:8922 stop:9986 length:1065 start_codon:yes stop_codon:yes gene_type:complete